MLREPQMKRFPPPAPPPTVKSLLAISKIQAPTINPSVPKPVNPKTRYFWTENASRSVPVGNGKILKFKQVDQFCGTWRGSFESSNPIEIQAFIRFATTSRGVCFEISKRQYESSSGDKIPESLWSIEDYQLEPDLTEFVSRQSNPTRENRIFHCVERHKQSNPDAYRRVRFALDSWLEVYLSGNVRPVHYWNYKRTSGEIGDPRRLPYLKDVLTAAMESGAKKGDIIMLTNDDTVLSPEIENVIFDFMDKAPAACSGRINYEFGSLPDFTRLYSDDLYEKDIGRDLFSFQFEFLKKNFNSIPDFLLGELEWDLVMATFIRKKSVNKSLQFRDAAYEIPFGYVFHENHEKLWLHSDNASSAAKKHNITLTSEWLIKEGMDKLATLNLRDI